MSIQDQLAGISHKVDMLGDMNQKQLNHIEDKVDELIRKQNGGDDSPFKKLEYFEMIVRCVEDGETIQAIKHMRSLTGAGLKEAKDMVEWYQSR